MSSATLSTKPTPIATLCRPGRPCVDEGAPEELDRDDAEGGEDEDAEHVRRSR